MKDITVIITGHDEGRILHRTLASVFRAVNYASKNDVDIEVILHMDTPSERLKKYVENSEYKKRMIIYENNFKDLGLSRNFASNKASGKYLAFIDGDDLFCEDWLFKAFSYAEKLGNENILHPEYFVNFETKNLIWRRISSTDPSFRYGALMYFNPWDATIFLNRSILQKCTFKKLTKESGFGYEDYAYFCDTLAINIQHLIVPATVVFVRAKKTGSLLMERSSIYSVLPMTKLFDREILSNYIAEKNGKEFLLKKKPRKSLKHRLLEPFPQLHLFLYRIKLKVFEMLNKVKKGFVESPESIPSWLFDEWKKINNTIEAEVFPPVNGIYPYSIYKEEFDDTFALEYLKEEEKINEHVILVSFIKVGGAEKVLFNFIDMIKNIYKGEKITVIATSQSESSGKSKLPNDVEFIDIGNLPHYFDDWKKENLLQKLLIQKAPSHIYNISSELGFVVFHKYGQALCARSALFAFMFCEFYDNFGKMCGYGTSYLDDCFDYLTKVFTDNQRYIDLLCNIYGFNKDKFVPLYQPAEVLDISKKKYHTNGELHLLWASRLDRQKHPEIIYEVAKNCLDFPVHIDVYGTKVLDKYFIPEKYHLPNIEYKGTFSNGLKEIASDYDGFIYTSEYDGMPNIILEAIGVGLPIISSNVGGIGDLLEDKKSVLFVNEFNDVDEYRKNIEYALKHRKEFNEYAQVAQKEMQKKHNWKTLEETIKNNLK